MTQHHRHAPPTARTTRRRTPGTARTTRRGWGSSPTPRVCIGCKACEVACKEWNDVPATARWTSPAWSYDNTSMLGASTWRHVAFVEQVVPPAPAAPPAAPARPAVTLGMPTTRPEGFLEPEASRPPSELDGAQGPSGSIEGVRWLMSSDVCKHCTHAACLDVCPTGALFRTEFGTVVVQDDVCNGCGYCVAACPYGVIGKRESTGRAHKCTLCYDRIGVGKEPACATACPTDSIQFGALDELRERADARLAELQAARRARRPALRARPGRRRRRRRGVLPAARRPRGVRPAAGPGGDHEGPAVDVAPRGGGRGRPVRRRRAAFAGPRGGRS